MVSGRVGAARGILMTPVQYMQNRKRPDIVALLIQYGASDIANKNKNVDF